MGNDVTDIETKHKDLQITAINQKLLFSELDALLNSLELPSWVPETLMQANLDEIDEIEQCEQAATKLKAIVHTDFENEIQQLGAVKERMAMFRKVTRDFTARLAAHVKSKLHALVDTSKDMIETKRKSTHGNFLPRLVILDSVVRELEPYTVLIQWTKLMDSKRLIEMRMVCSSPVAQECRISLNSLLR